MPAPTFDPISFSPEDDPFTVEGDGYIDKLNQLSVDFTETVDYLQTVDTALGNSAGVGRNKIIGGDFSTNPWQRGTSFIAAAIDTYTADRWIVLRSNDAVVDILKTADAPAASEAGIHATHCLHADVTTADAAIAAGQYYVMEYRIEGHNVAPFGFGQAGVRNITLSFWVKATKIGTYCVSFRNSASNRCYIAEYTVSASDTWEMKTITLAVDTAGVWLYDAGVGLRLDFALAAGSTFHAIAGAWQAANVFATANQVNALDSVGNNFKLALVQLEAGQVATEFEALPVGQVLQLCQRYYQQYKGIAPNRPGIRIQGYLPSSSNSLVLPIILPVVMRAAPTATITGVWNVTNCGQPQVVNVAPTGLELSAGALAAGMIDAFTDAAEDGLTLSAEL